MPAVLVEAEVEVAPVSLRALPSLVVLEEVVVLVSSNSSKLLILVPPSL